VRASLEEDADIFPLAARRGARTTTPARQISRLLSYRGCLWSIMDVLPLLQYFLDYGRYHSGRRLPEPTIVLSFQIQSWCNHIVECLKNTLHPFNLKIRNTLIYRMPRRWAENTIQSCPVENRNAILIVSADSFFGLVTGPQLTQ